MSKYNTSSLVQKIASRNKEEVLQHAADRFARADDALGVVVEKLEKKEETVPFTRVIKKTFSIPESELDLVEKIKDIALNKRIVLAESEVLRLGLLVVSELSEEALEVAANRDRKSVV